MSRENVGRGARIPFTGVSARRQRRTLDERIFVRFPAVESTGLRRPPAGPRSADLGGIVPPDLVGHHYGHAGYRDVWRAMLDGFEDLTLEQEELLDLGDRVISVTRMRGHGSGSRVPIDQLLFQVFTFRRGLVVKQEDFGDRREALAAVGLRG